MSTVISADHPPNTARTVLAWVDETLGPKGWTVCWYSNDSRMWFYDVGGNHRLRPTHWTELPPAPA